jgi:uncharacterized protein
MSNNLNQIDQESRTWGMIAHLSTFAGYVIPLGNIVGPLVIWILKKDQMEFVNDQGKEALNFQLSVLIYLIVCIILCFVVIGFFLLIALLIFDLVVTIIAAVRANEGVRYRYPMRIAFFK